MRCVSATSRSRSIAFDHCGIFHSKVFSGEFIVFVGPSGCGKSTLLRIFNRIYSIYPGQRASGEVMLDGVDALVVRLDRDLGAQAGIDPRRGIQHVAGVGGEPGGEGEPPVLGDAADTVDISSAGVRALEGAPMDALAEKELQRLGGSADGFVALPGGLGTLEEFFEVWTWGQLGEHTKPVGLVNAGMWIPPDDIEAGFGEAVGSQLNRMLGAAPALVFSLVDKYSIDCQLRREGTLHMAHNARGEADLRSREEQWKRRGAPVELLTGQACAEATGTDRIAAALLDRRAGTLNPMAYTSGLAKAAKDMGAGAVLISACVAVVIGLLIFGPPLIARLAHWVIE